MTCARNNPGCRSTNSVSCRDIEIHRRWLFPMSAQSIATHFMLCAAIPSLKARTGVRSLALIIRSDDERGEKDQTPTHPVFVGKLPLSVSVRYGLVTVCGLCTLS